MTEQRAPDPEQQRPATVRRSTSSADEAMDTQTVVTAEQGRWVVEVVTVFADGVTRTRVDSFATKERADLAAGLIRRAAERDIAGPRNG